MATHWERIDKLIKRTPNASNDPVWQIALLLAIFLDNQEGGK